MSYDQEIAELTNRYRQYLRQRKIEVSESIILTRLYLHYQGQRIQLEVQSPTRVELELTHDKPKNERVTIQSKFNPNWTLIDWRTPEAKLHSALDQIIQTST
jgi:hypothetical protein